MNWLLSNMVKDLNKDITEAGAEGIKYNHLNLPYEIKVKEKGTIGYIYDAAVQHPRFSLIKAFEYLDKYKRGWCKR